MKNFSIIFSVLLFVGFLFSSFTAEPTSTEYKVIVNLSYSGGSPCVSCPVEGKVCGLTGGMTKKVYTDKKGNATLTMYSNDDLCAIFVRGKRHDGRWEHGETAYFRVN